MANELGVVFNAPFLVSLKSIHQQGRIQGTALTRLSTGLRINSAADDVAQISAFDKLKGDSANVSGALANAQQAGGVLSLADQFLINISDMLTQMAELASQAANDATLTTAQRNDLNTQYSNLRSQIGAILTRTKYNSKGVFTGSMRGSVNLGGVNVYMNIASIKLSTLRISGRNLVTKSAASQALSATLQGISVLGARQASVGNYIVFINSIIDDLESRQIGLEAATGAIANADIAAEVTALLKSQIISQSATAMIAQISTSKSAVMKLLGIGS